MRPALEQAGRQAHAVEQRARRGRVVVRQQGQRLAQDALHAEARIEGGGAVLEHHADLAPLPQRARARIERERLAVQRQAAARGGHHAHEHARQRRLAGSGFADHGQHLGGMKPQRDAAQRLHAAVRAVEDHAGLVDR
nr:hypothetical protein [Variovorax sp.]